MKLLLVCTIACSFVGALSEDQQNVGAYEGKVTSIEECSDPGKNIFSLDVKFDEEKDTWNGVFHKKDQLGDNVMINLEILHQVEGEWKKEFSQNLGGICTLIKAAPDAVINFMEAMNITGCPMSEGSTTIKDLKNSFTIPFMKEMNYGERQGLITLMDKDGNRLGCFSTKGKVVPKPE